MVVDSGVGPEPAKQSQFAGQKAYQQDGVASRGLSGQLGLPLEIYLRESKQFAGRSPSGNRDAFDDVRHFHRWSNDKLTILRLYLAGYRRVAGGGTFIDGFCGSGRAEIDGELREGSPAVALRTGGFRRYVFVDKPDVIKLLDSYLRRTFPMKVRQKARLVGGDCNTELPKMLDSGAIPANQPCFAFLDQNATDLRWSTVSRLAEFKHLDASHNPPQCKVELFILFNSGHAMRRLWPKNRAKFPDTMSASTLNQVFGERQAWWDLWELGYPSGSLLTRYCERLRDLGYLSVVSIPIRDRKSRLVQYHLVHASDHGAAVDLMKWASRTTDKENDAQLGLF